MMFPQKNNPLRPIMAGSRSRPHPLRRVFVALAAVVIVLVLAMEWLAPRFLPGVFSAMSAPLWRAQFSAQAGAMSGQGSLLAQNESLKVRVSELQSLSAQAQALYAENAELKAILGRADLASSSPANAVLAPVLERPPLSAYDELIIDGGSDLGFVAGDEVYAPGRVPIGKIASVQGSVSSVGLYSSPGKTYAVEIGPSALPAQAVGMGGGQYSAELSRDENAAVGDFVLSASKSFGRSVFGTVSSVTDEASAPFKHVIFAPPVNIYELRWVLVEKGK